MKQAKIDDGRMIAAHETAQRNPMRPPDSLPRDAGAALRVFWSHPSSLIIAGFVLLFGGWRIALGGFGWIDAAIALGVLAYFPVNEWLIHVVMLHFRPRRLFGRTIDFYLPKTHRRHHADPWNLAWVFIPRHVHLLVAPTVALLLWALWPWKEWVLSGVTAYLLLGLHYEWVHFLAHIPWCPDHAYYKRRVREHRYHHFRNENYWWGVSMGLGDRLFGTAPKVEDVGRSGTTHAVGTR
ncbi:sterol desaturase family protein [Sinimarinibacterium flocculans]|uniref:Fatty acid hydroxylase family protein n=1 Tax=Sinimarinibacterium flocculans TaxID=985250 RepID=A0A318E4B8_9GAMM|nr:sterol desaturase family protein [Sinimarinibacterium flocculans]PXV65186.1 fatty acid hydroxylase family protein [Sinimarinibacterium flocculans]